MLYNEAALKKLREKYPKGTVVILDKMFDYHAVPSGTRGVVQFVDDAANIHVRWENGSGLALCPDLDKFHVEGE